MFLHIWITKSTCTFHVMVFILSTFFLITNGLDCWISIPNEKCRFINSLLFVEGIKNFLLCLFVSLSLSLSLTFPFSVFCPSPPFSSVGWGCRIHQLHFCSGVRYTHTPTSVLDMTLNHLLGKLQSWNFGKCGVTLSLLLLSGPLRLKWRPNRWDPLYGSNRNI